MTCRLDACCQGRNACPAPSVCADKPTPLIQDEGGITFVGDEPLYTAEEMSFAALLLAGLTVLTLVALVAYLVWTVAPIFRTAL